MNGQRRPVVYEVMGWIERALHAQAPVGLIQRDVGDIDCHVIVEKAGRHVFRQRVGLCVANENEDQALCFFHGIDFDPGPADQLGFRRVQNGAHGPVFQAEGEGV